MKPEDKAVPPETGTDVGDTPDAAAQSAALARWRAVDLFEWTRRGLSFEGAVPLSALPRIVEMLPAGVPDEAKDTPVTFTARAAMQREGGAVRPTLDLHVSGLTWLECQDCLGPFELPIEIDTPFRVVQTEEQADAIPLDDDGPDVIVGSATFDLLDLIDEEIALSLPMVPRHETCPTANADDSVAPIVFDDTAAAPAEEGERRRPFAGLAEMIERKRNTH
ncbi:YceD family protein [Chitinasiproducens palmae]|uniref:Large ribosomal RNA subunit accumulation protein YceD n=1 Tax=Chitinasiproducens palmae TaxID=1770053 RepID=A0A1H2PWN8_9BURK|nr:YceD family protein [Chitinasiproducens palmae]SDV50977.1 uncharacterized protein SAMN05216551_11474 [Chitinasiproducens palmae]